jgi:pilus assembly protein Flp/PilA
MNHLRHTINRLAPEGSGLDAPGREQGQALVEYAFILVLIALVVIGVLTFLGGDISSIFGSISESL